MKNKNLSKKDIDLINEIGSLRFIDRNWKQLLKLRTANLAEHTLRVVWIAMIIGKNEKDCDIDKVIKMALIHDVPESRTGDATRMQKNYCQRDENKAIKEIFEGTIAAEEIKKLWQEYKERKSIESKIVKDADVLDVDFEIREHQVNGYQFPKSWLTGRKRNAKVKLFTKSARKIWGLLDKSDVHGWHVEMSQ